MKSKLNLSKRSKAGFIFALLFLLSILSILGYIKQDDFNVQSWFGIFFAAFIVIISGYGLFRVATNKYKQTFDSSDSLSIIVSDKGVICRYPPSDDEREVLWADVSRVRVWTTNEGPGVCDVFIVLEDSAKNVVIIPQDREECKLIVDRIFKFPGFDFATFTSAMGSSDNAYFDVWEKKN